MKKQIKILKNLANKIFLSIVDKPLPTPSSEELVFLSDLLDTFRGLQDCDAVEGAPVDPSIYQAPKYTEYIE